MAYDRKNGAQKIKIKLATNSIAKIRPYFYS